MAEAHPIGGGVVNVELNTRFQASAFTLRVPTKLNDEISLLCRAGTPAQGRARAHAQEEHVPFRRKIDFWLLALAVACALDLSPDEEPSSLSGTKFVDTQGLPNLPEHFGGFLMTLAISEWGYQDSRLKDLSEVVELANRFAGVGAPKLLAATRPAGDQTRLEVLLQSVTAWREAELARSGLELGGLDIQGERVPTWD